MQQWKYIPFHLPSFHSVGKTEKTELAMVLFEGRSKRVEAYIHSVQEEARGEAMRGM